MASGDVRRTVRVDWNAVGPDGRYRTLADNDFFRVGDLVDADDGEGTKLTCVIEGVLLVLRIYDR